MKFDYLIVGAGLFGASFARIASDHRKRCLVIDRLPYVAGIAHDRKWENGVIVSEHGAHIFHTHSTPIWEFVGRFGRFLPLRHRVKAVSEGRLYSFPINLMTLNQLWGVSTPTQAEERLATVRIPYTRPTNLEQWALSRFGREIYAKFIYGYTKKQWQREPHTLPASIIRRLPFRLTLNDDYFSDQHQGIPEHGYSQLITNMLDGISLELNVDFFSLRQWTRIAKHLVYSGPIDRLFRYQFGRLDYNTLRFEHRVFAGDFQGGAVLNHVDLSVPFLRTVEHRHLRPGAPTRPRPPNESLSQQTVITYEFPAPLIDDCIPYYPVRDVKNSETYSKYEAAASRIQNLTIGGRLGLFKYINMDQTVGAAISKARKALI